MKLLVWDEPQWHAAHTEFQYNVSVSIKLISAFTNIVITELWSEISSSHGGEYEVQICLLGCIAV
jgi:hypothetical protein